MKELHAEYWRMRCELAERCLAASPDDPDVTKEQIEAHRVYNEFLSSPDSTVLHTGFTELLERLGMHYSLSLENGYHFLKIADNGESLDHGHHFFSDSVYGAIEKAMTLLDV